MPAELLFKLTPGLFVIKWAANDGVATPATSSPRLRLSLHESAIRCFTLDEAGETPWRNDFRNCCKCASPECDGNPILDGLS